MIEPKRTGMLERITESQAFLAVSMLFVLIDQLVTVLATNHAARNLDDSTPIGFSIIDYVCLGYFFLELLLKIWVHRFYFFIGVEWKMNCMDTFLVAYGFFEAVGPDLSFLRALRVFKMAKMVRMFKGLRAVRDLRVMLDCLIGS